MQRSLRTASALPTLVLLAACASSGLGDARGPSPAAESTGTVPAPVAQAPAPAALAAASDLDPEVTAAFARADAALAAIAALPDDQRTFENTLDAVDAAIARLFREVRYAGFMKDVHPDPAVRATGQEVATALSNWFNELMLDEDLHRAVVAYAATEPRLEGERARLLDEFLRDFRRAGMELDADERARVAELDRELVEVGQAFRENIASDETLVALTAEELAGVPEDVLASYGRSHDLYLVDMAYPSVLPIFQRCEVPSTRHKVSLAFSRRGGEENVRVLERMIALRHERAQLLGYPTTAHYETEIKMARDPETVMAFYADLIPKLRAKALQDVELYTAAKREHTGDPDAVLNPWDRSYYHSWLQRTKFAVDQREVQQYFPIDAVFDGIFDLTQELFGLRFQEVTAESDERGRPLWHPDVRLFDVFDEASGEKLGEFFTDLHPRPGKFSHAAQFPIALRKVHADGEVELPVVALVCNFTKPTADAPSLLTHDEVETFFHEFGHCIHSILSDVDLAWFAGTQVARDFVEAPSQMLENWIWDADILARFARHHETGEPLPSALLDGLIAAKNLGSGYSAEYQVYLGQMDMAFHMDPDGAVDTTAVSRDVYARACLLPAVEGSLGHASFGHLNGYQAGYYGYLWSLVYAQDMFTPFADGDLLDAELGQRFRRSVLARGGTVDALDLVRDFLGREPNSDAFLVHLGLEP